MVDYDSIASFGCLHLHILQLHMHKLRFGNLRPRTFLFSHIVQVHLKLLPIPNCRVLHRWANNDKDEFWQVQDARQHVRGDDLCIFTSRMLLRRNPNCQGNDRDQAHPHPDGHSLSYDCTCVEPRCDPLEFPARVWYALLRIVSIGVLGAVAGYLVEWFAGVKGEGGKVYSCSGCSNSGRVKQTQEKNFVIASWDLLISLLRPIFIGILVGAIVAKYVPSSLIATILSPGYVGLVVATVIALPVYLCHGQEVALLRPLMSTSLLGSNALPVGHAIAFTLAGTGICASAVPPLVAILGKKAASIVLLTFFLGSILVGAAINLLLQMI
uniref:Permease n=1 Tax=Candidatus Methanosuratincola petrocarbonis (ex Vanwonterghem et al. 2016) TaxID=1867261 RepID=A0A7J3UYF3_9CREN